MAGVRMEAGPDMTIGYVLDRFPSLHQTFVLHELLALQELGVSLAVFSLKPAAGLAHEEVGQLRVPVVCAPPLSRVDRVAAAVLRSLVTHPVRWGRSAAEAAAARQRVVGTNWLRAQYLAPAAASLSVQHLHAHFASGANVAAMHMAARNGISFSFTTHAVDLYARPVQLCQTLQRAAFGVTISEYNRRFLAETCGPELAERVAVVRAGIDPARFGGAPLPQVGEVGATGEGTPADDVPCLLSVGRLVEKKGHRTLVEAMAILRDRGIAARAVIVGDGPERPALADLIDRHQLVDAVELRPSITQTELVALLPSADLFVLPCVIAADGDRDGIPVSLMEAMAAGLPVVSTTVSGIPELVDESAGVLVPPRDAAALAAALAELATQPERRRRLGEGGRRIVRQRFDVARSALQMAELFREAVAGRADGVRSPPRL